MARDIRHDVTLGWVSEEHEGGSQKLIRGQAQQGLT